MVDEVVKLNVVSIAAVVAYYQYLVCWFVERVMVVVMAPVGTSIKWT